MAILQEIVPSLKICSLASGTRAFDWTVPREWRIKAAYIEDECGEKIIDFKNNNLHLMGYSVPVDKIVSKAELLQHIHTLPQQPDAIPYVTSYYKENFGFCMSENQKNSLKEGNYRMLIDSELFDGELNYGEIFIPATSKTDKEIFLSTYICHPSMANNELSGPVVTINLANAILQLKERSYNYRIIFIPETIGSVCYLSKHLTELQQNMLAGFNLSCVGDDRTYSFLPSRYGCTLADKAAKNILSFHYPEYKSYSFLDRGSDERQYCAPGVDLPLCSIMRTKYGEYSEYHTSLDNLSLVTPEGLQGAFDVYMKCIMALEHNNYYKVNCLCEPQLGKRGLYPNSSFKGSVTKDISNMTDFLAYADGKNDIFDISNIIKVPVDELIPIIKTLLKAELIS